MFLVLTLILLFIFIYRKNYAETKANPLIIVALGFIVYMLFVIESKFFGIPYFISDEAKYINQQTNDYKSYVNRITWYLINLFETKIDIYPNFGIKVINIPILIFTFYQLWKIFNKNNNVFLIILLLPYFYILSIRNFRDIFALFLLVNIIYYSFYKFKWYLLILFLGLMFFTRYYLIFTFILSVIIIYSWSIIKPRRKIKRNFYISKRILYTGIASLIVIICAFYFIPDIQKRLNVLLRQVNYYLTDYHFKRLEKLGIAETGFVILDYIVGAVRYFFTPIPTSILKRALNGATDYGFLDDIVRFVNQTIYYFMLFYLIIYNKYLRITIKSLTTAQKIIIFNLILFLIYYSIYRFGIGHQRVKLPFQLGIALLFVETIRVKSAYKKINLT